MSLSPLWLNLFLKIFFLVVLWHKMIIFLISFSDSFSLMYINANDFVCWFCTLWLCGCSVGSVMSDSLRPYGLQPTRLLYPLDSPGKNTGMGCHALLQGIFLTQGLNPHLLHCRQILYQRITGEAPLHPITLVNSFLVLIVF